MGVLLLKNKFQPIQGVFYDSTSITKNKRENYCKKYDSDERNKAIKKLNLASNNFLLFNPFFGYLLIKQNLVDASTWVPTAGVDGENFFYNVGFINELSVQDVQFLLFHEILHLIYGHLLRLNYPNGLPRVPKIFNIANDYIVNADAYKSLSLQSSEMSLPNGCYHSDLYADYNSEEVYEDLIKKMKEQILEKRRKEKKDKEQNKEKDQDSENDPLGNPFQNFGFGDDEDEDGDGGGDGGDDIDQEITNEDLEEEADQMHPSGTFDEHFDLSGNATEENEDEIRKDEDGNLIADKPITSTAEGIDRKMEKLKGDIMIGKEMISDEHRKMAGCIPAGVARVIKELEEPVFNWRQYIKKYILGLKKKTPSWTTPRRRGFDSSFILPGKKPEPLYKVHISLDTSGSVSEEELKDFLSEVYGAARQLGNIEIKIWTFDTKVYNVQTFKKRDIHKIVNYDIYGNGGTDFMLNWEFMKEENINPDLFIMFTDGGYWGEPGIKNYCPTLYVIHDKYKSSVNIDPAFGKTIFYKKDSKTRVSDR